MLLAENDYEVEIFLHAANTNKPFHNVSKRYVHFNTGEIVKKLLKHNFVVTNYQEDYVRRYEKQGYQKHMVTLCDRKDLNDTEHRLELKIINSHDGRHSLQVLFGLFRKACSNGMMVSSVANISLRHCKNHIEYATDKIIDIAENTDEIREMPVKMLERQLAVEEKALLTTKAFSLLSDTVRKGLDVRKLGIAKRWEDKGDNLWLSYNRLQEDLTKGNLLYWTNKGFRQVRNPRAIKSIKDINIKLWNCAVSFLNN